MVVRKKSIPHLAYVVEFEKHAYFLKTVCETRINGKLRCELKDFPE